MRAKQETNAAERFYRAGQRHRMKKKRKEKRAEMELFLLHWPPETLAGHTTKLNVVEEDRLVQRQQRFRGGAGTKNKPSALSGNLSVWVNWRACGSLALFLSGRWLGLKKKLQSYKTPPTSDLPCCWITECTFWRCIHLLNIHSELRCWCLLVFIYSGWPHLLHRPSTLLRNHIFSPVTLPQLPDFTTDTHTCIHPHSTHNVLYTHLHKMMREHQHKQLHQVHGWHYACSGRLGIYTHIHKHTNQAQTPTVAAIQRPQTGKHAPWWEWNSHQGWYWYACVSACVCARGCGLLSEHGTLFLPCRW